MTAISFKAYAHAADDLISQDGSDAWLSNPAFHPLREHPGLPWGEELLARSQMKRLIHVSRTWGAQLLLAGSRLRPPSFWIGHPIGAAFGTINHRVIFISHRLPGPTGPARDDFYFGSMPKSFDSVVLCIDHRPLLARLFSRREDDSARVTLPPSLGWREEAKNLACTVVAIRKLFRRLKNESELHDRQVLHLALLRSADMLSNLRIARSVELAVQEIDPSVIIFTFEGHAWERLAIRAAKRGSAGISALAYPHAGVFLNQHSLFRCLPGGPNPDGFLAPGSISADQIKERIPNAVIEVVGSPRRVNVQNIGIGTRNVCLVLPEGLVSEVRLLVSVSAKLARERPEIDFVIRLHPMVADFRSTMSFSTSIQTLPNMRISHEPLDADIARARWCLYRGSTAAVMAVAAGIIPLHFRQASEPVIDPLFSLWGHSTQPRHVMNSAPEIALALDKTSINSEATEVAQLYFTRESPESIQRILHRLRGNL